MRPEGQRLFCSDRRHPSQSLSSRIFSTLFSGTFAMILTRRFCSHPFSDDRRIKTKASPLGTGPFDLKFSVFHTAMVICAMEGGESARKVFGSGSPAAFIDATKADAT